jgi:hypothetical protein
VLGCESGVGVSRADMVTPSMWWFGGCGGRRDAEVM